MRILLGMSGGLDSTYSALKLKEEGHSVEGAVLIMHDFTELDEARRSAKELGIRLHEIDCRELFNNTVISDFVHQYEIGRTPNPCIVCNREVKFKALYDYAMKNGFDRIATGHYARIEEIEENGRKLYAVVRAADSLKDQTYMLWRLPQHILSVLMLPLSFSSKEKIRTLAREREITAADRDDSQEICFIPSGDHGAYIEERFGKSKAGDFVDCDGNILGRHKGIIHYTVGQRKGLGIALGQRAFITAIDPLTDRITLSFSQKENREFFVSGLMFSGMEEMPAGSEMTAEVKVRYQAPPVPVTVHFLEKGRARITADLPIRSVAPGQSAVFYRNERLLFGAFID